MSSDMHPTRRTRIHPKGVQSPLEGLAPTGRQGRIKAPFAGTICSTSFLKLLLFEHGREAHPTKCVEGEFCELRIDGVLRNSQPLRNGQVTPKIAHLSDTPTPLTGVCCTRYVTRGRRVSIDRTDLARDHGGDPRL